MHENCAWLKGNNRWAVGFEATFNHTVQMCSTPCQRKSNIIQLTTLLATFTETSKVHEWRRIDPNTANWEAIKSSTIDIGSCVGNCRRHSLRHELYSQVRMRKTLRKGTSVNQSIFSTLIRIKRCVQRSRTKISLSVISTCKTNVYNCRGQLLKTVTVLMCTMRVNEFCTSYLLLRSHCTHITKRILSRVRLAWTEWDSFDVG